MSAITEEEIERLVCVTHIHEAAIKDQEINQMLLAFYKKICDKAKEKGIRFSVVDTRQWVKEVQPLDG